MEQYKKFLEKIPFFWTTREGVKISVDNMTDSHIFYARRMLLKHLPTLNQKRQNVYKHFEAIGTKISFKCLIYLINEDKYLREIGTREANSLFRKGIEQALDDAEEDDDLLDTIPFEVIYKTY